jgi:hypothetical protein
VRQEAASESASRLGRFAKSQSSDEAKKKQPDAVKRIQDFAKQEAERKRREEEEKKKKGQVQTAPEKGFLQRMYEKYVGGEKK